MHVALIFIFGLFCHFNAFAYNDEPACFRAIETTFFSYEILAQAMSLHHVDPSQWEPIYQKLQERSQHVPQAVRSKVANDIISPLEYPFNAKEAVKIMYQVLYEMFTQVLREVNITNESDYKGMFSYIRRHQAEKIKSCLGTN